MTFTSKNIFHYAFAVGLIVLASYFGNSFKQTFYNKDEEEYELIRKYLLNDSPLYGFNKPKLWIHSKYEINARKWKSFQSRNTTDLNQPYIHLTIKSIINHCGDDFNICLIDDESFSRLLPSWDINISTVAEPMKSQYRELAMMELLYVYGGMVVPNSFLCLQNLTALYKQGIQGDRPFVCESVNHFTDLLHQKHKKVFTPDILFMGTPKRNAHIREFANALKLRSQNPHFNSESEFLGYTSRLCNTAIKDGKMNIIDGTNIGVKTVEGKPILLEDLMEENYLKLSPNVYGIYIPREEILTRTKYQWFAAMSSQEILKTNAIISKYMIKSIIDIKPIENDTIIVESPELRTVISI